MDFSEDKTVVTEVPVSITVNQHSETIDGLVERRKFLHTGMLQNLWGEVERELQPLDLLANTIVGSGDSSRREGGNRQGRPGRYDDLLGLIQTPESADTHFRASHLRGSENTLTSFCAAVRATCEDLMATHEGTEAGVFNDDERFSMLVSEGVVMKKTALRIDKPGAGKGAVLGAWFSRSSQVSPAGLEACVDVVGAKVFVADDVKDGDAVTPLMSASGVGSSRLAEALIKARADVNTVDVEKRAPWNFVSQVKDESKKAAVMEVLSTHSLHAAAYFGRTELVASLIDAGRDVNATAAQYERTPAHLAAVGGHSEALQLLANAGADVNAKDTVSEGLELYDCDTGCGEARSARGRRVVCLCVRLCVCVCVCVCVCGGREGERKRGRCMCKRDRLCACARCRACGCGTPARM